MDCPISLNLTQLVTTTSKGLEKLGELCFGGMLRRKEYQDILMSAQAEKDKQAIAAGMWRFDGKKCVPVIQVSDMSTLPLPLAIEQEQEIQNLAGNLQIAYNHLSTTPDDQISAESVASDWFARWRREAKVIGDPELQTLWGKILAEEVKNTRSISFKTLDILKNTTPEEAKLFCSITPFIVHNLLVCRRGKRYPKGIGLGTILELFEAGFLRDSGSLLRKGHIEKPSDTVEYKTRDFAIIFNIDNKKSCLPGIPLSTAGMEILKICDVQFPTLEQIKEMVDIAATSHETKTGTIVVHKIVDGIIDMSNILYKKDV